MRTLQVIRSMALIIVLGAALVAADRPHKAMITTESGDQRAIFVFAETFDGVAFAQDESSDKAQGKMSWDRISNLEYESSSDPNVARGIGAYNKQDFAKAAEFLGKAVKTGRTEYTRVSGITLQVDALKASKDAAGAAAAIDVFVAAHPENPVIMKLLNSKALILLDSGDHAGAEAAFDDLGKKASGFGSYAGEAKGLAIAGKAQVQLSKGDHAGAIETVTGALESLNRSKNSTAYARAAIIGVRAKQATQDTEGAKALATDIQYLGDDVATQVEAHLTLAEILEASDPEAAFDHAAIAALRGRGTPKGAAARKLAISLASAMSKDESRTAEQRQAFKNYTRSL